MNYKDEMIKKYCYLNELSDFLYSVFMRCETEEEKEKYKELASRVSSINEWNNYKFQLIDLYTFYMLECLLFEDKPMEQTEGYRYFEIMRNNDDYIKKAKEGKIIRDTYNKEHPCNPIYFDVYELFSNIYEYVSRQNNDLENKRKKESIIDEYIRIAKYSNDKNEWTGGYYLDNIDSYYNSVNFRFHREGIDLTPNRASYDVGIKNNGLIEKSLNISFTRKEKERIYLHFHDELPYDLKIRCDYNGIYEIDRPFNSEPCKQELILKEKNIFSLMGDNDCIFLTLCPSCNFLVGVPSDLLPLSVQEKIVLENKKDPSIYEKSFLESEIKALKKRPRK